MTRVIDRDYLDSLREERCVVTGRRARPDDAVDPVHIGTYAMGLKTDDEALPILHSVHVDMHQHGEMTVLRALLPDGILRAALRALAREMYRDRV